MEVGEKAGNRSKGRQVFLWMTCANVVARLKMPSSNPLSFLRPLYDIAVWQFILMSGYHATTEEESPRIQFTWKMHEVVANFLCKLLEVRAFSHLQSKLLAEEVKSATGNWEVGQRAPKKLVEWCQDQWRRKDPRLPSSNAAYSENEPLTVPWFDNVPACHRCGVPCPCCRNELAYELPFEMSTAQAILRFDEIHENNQNMDENDDDGVDEQSGKALNEPELVSPQMRMQLRSRKRKHIASN